MGRLRFVVSAAAAAVLLVMGMGAPASAHTSLIDVDPDDGATVASGDTVTLTFSEDLLAIGAEAGLTDSAGVVTALEVTFPTAASAQVLLPSMAAGDVSLAWRVVATDGHPIEGTLTFAAQAPVAPTQGASGGPSATPSATQAPTPAATVTPPTGAAGEGDDNRSGVPLALWIALFATVLASSTAILASKRRQ